MSYLDELKAQRRTKAAEMVKLMGDGSRSLNNRERQHFADIDQDLKDLDTTISQVQASDLDTRGDMPGKRADNRSDRKYKHNKRVTGRTGEVLDSKMSMRQWVDKAADRGMTVEESRGARPSPIIGSSFDENAYWGQRMGLARPGAEMRALGEDTVGSGQAITPQSWTARFIDYLYPKTMLGQLGASVVPMQTELVNVPQLTGAVAPQWVAENSATSLDANPAFSTLQLAAHGMFYDITLFSMELAQDAYIQGDLPGVLADSAAKNYAVLVDTAGFYGIAGNTGCPGFSNEVGVVMRKYGQGGASSNTAHTVTTGQLITDTQEPSTLMEMVRSKNVEPTGFATSPQFAGTFNRINVPSYGKVWEVPADAADLWTNHTATSVTIPVTETDPAAGTNPAQTAGTMTSLYCADWSRVYIGMHLGMQTAVLKERYADSLQVGLLTYTRFCVRLTHPEAFVRSYGALTT
jgi:HK97 family phage major capsid protein